MKSFPFWHSIVRKTAKKWKVARLYEILNSILSQSDHVNLLHCTILLVPSHLRLSSSHTINSSSSPPGSGSTAFVSSFKLELKCIVFPAKDSNRYFQK